MTAVKNADTVHVKAKRMISEVFIFTARVLCIERGELTELSRLRLSLFIFRALRYLLGDHHYSANRGEINRGLYVGHCIF